ncbi:glyoxylate/hydroxypyruvate reductase A [Bradyrhizobium sp.]|uniref:2-hydroxyacid dehydrogenase n=1 Tax=Bradyrhizobium sp. TaxID=376 RepID=UPI0023A05148|nr:glyoxylate/hydroxypyruvate reductase A [Bradyrhizobium sp.]MDE1934793.1 glyoxylate/hydroxypyruvate reductase A [Bradyrhizobium sp.]
MTTKRGTLALLIHGGTENWSPARWKQRFDEVCADRPVWLAAEGGGDPASVHYAAVWKPVPGELAGFPNLKVIFNLGAGVDALMADKTLPKVPLVRVSVGDLTHRMSEYVALHVLMHHRQELYLRESQRAKRWAPRYQWPAGAITVGIMGLGTLGADAAEVLVRLGFRVVGWSNSPKRIDRVECFHGKEQLDVFLRRTDILVSLLPLTPDTRHILNRELFLKLNRSGPMGAPVVINAGRGGLQNEVDILSCLDDGTLGAVSLDVYATEPLPPDNPFWTHPKVVLTPHNAADTDPDEISKYVARQIARFEAGQSLENLVDPARGY